VVRASLSLANARLAGSDLFDIYIVDDFTALLFIPSQTLRSEDPSAFDSFHTEHVSHGLQIPFSSSLDKDLSVILKKVLVPQTPESFNSHPYIYHVIT
jgi:hypothetical protein